MLLQNRKKKTILFVWSFSGCVFWQLSLSLCVGLIQMDRQINRFELASLIPRHLQIPDTHHLGNTMILDGLINLTDWTKPTTSSGSSLHFLFVLVDGMNWPITAGVGKEKGGAGPSACNLATDGQRFCVFLQFLHPCSDPKTLAPPTYPASLPLNQYNCTALGEAAVPRLQTKPSDSRGYD